jgi:hypothetical protein
MSAKFKVIKKVSNYLDILCLTKTNSSKLLKNKNYKKSLNIVNGILINSSTPLWLTLINMTSSIIIYLVFTVFCFFGAVRFPRFGPHFN